MMTIFEISITMKIPDIYFGGFEDLGGMICLKI